ncbi:MAG: four-helix bundle copper-binding protein [Pseudomonadota bacterium]
MSIAKMLAAHPDVDGHVNDPLAETVRHAMWTAALATSNADACVAEEHIIKMRQCFRKSSDLADVATMFASLATRRTGSNQAVLKAAMSLLKTAAEECRDETARHDHDHCARMNTMCEELLADIEKTTL